MLYEVKVYIETGIMSDRKMVMRDLDSLEKYDNIWDDVWMIPGERDNETASEQRVA
jgi:hypothetical protein